MGRSAIALFVLVSVCVSPVVTMHHRLALRALVPSLSAYDGPGDGGESGEGGDAGDMGEGGDDGGGDDCE